MPDDRDPIEISLALTQVGKVFDSFVAELKDITASLNAMKATTTAETLAANKTVADKKKSSASHAPKNDLPPTGPSAMASRVARRVLAGNRELSPAGLDFMDKHDGKMPSPLTLKRDATLTPREKLAVARQGYGLQMSDNAGTPIDKYKKQWEKANLFEKYYVAQSLTQHVLHGLRSAGSHNPMNLGTDLGYAQEGGSIGWWQTPLALGSEAGRRGISEWFRRKELAWQTPGLGTKDIGEIQGSLYKQGWVEGGARDRMMNAMVDVKKRYKGMDSDLMASMLDQGTRYGTGTVNDMVGILKKIPDAAHAAGLGMNEMVDAINAVANSSQKQGATFKQGAAFGLQALVTTGRDPRIAQQLSENPFVQSRIMAQTGILPQAQGALDPNQRLNLGNKSLREQYNIYRGMRAMPARDPLTGKVHPISGEAQALSMTADATGLSVDVVKSQLKDERRQALFNNLLTHTRYSSMDVAGAADKRNWAGADKELLETTQIDKMQRQGILTGKQADDIWHATAQAVQKADKESDPEKRKALLKDAGTDKLRRLSAIAKDSTKDQIQKSAGKDRVQIALTGTAEKFFKVLSKNTHTTWDDAKGIAQAGGEVLLQGAPNLGKLVENQAANILGFGG